VINNKFHSLDFDEYDQREGFVVKHLHRKTSNAKVTDGTTHETTYDAYAKKRYNYQEGSIHHRYGLEHVKDIKHEQNTSKVQGFNEK
jgi:hypothetical protein